MVLDLTPDSSKEVYQGCSIRGKGGRPTLMMPMAEAERIFRKNLGSIALRDNAFVVTGRMGPWVFMVTLDVLKDAGKKVSYFNGEEEIVICEGKN